MLSALVLGHAELVALVVPLLATTSVALTARRRPPDVTWGVELERDRLLEGEKALLRLHLRSDSAVPQLELSLSLPRALRVRDRNPVILRLEPDRPRMLEFQIDCPRWGSYPLGAVSWRARDRFAFLRWEGRLPLRRTLRVYPRRERLLSLVPPLQTQVFTGNRVSRAKGAGIEFADTREFRPGDRIRSINWRASARRGELIVNEHRPERSSDVVLLVDTFAEVRDDERGTIDEAVRAAASLAAAYLAGRDRVGLVTFGGQISWLRPGFGPGQLYRLTESLIEAEVVLTHVAHDVDVLPPRTLPPQALVIALTPLADARATNVILNLRGRGFDIAVVEVSPASLLPAARTARDELARRLWSLSRDSLRASLRRAGIPVMEWAEEAALGPAIEEVARSRRRAMPIRA